MKAVVQFSFILLASISLVISGCRKEPEEIELTVSGTVSDPFAGATLDGVDVRLAVNEVTAGIWNNSYVSLDQSTTSSDGRFSYTFEQRNAVDYRLRWSKDGYFDNETFIDPEDITTAMAYDQNYALYSKAWFKVQLVNSNPFDQSDYVIYQQTRGAGNCNACCQSTQMTLNGPDVDTTMTCTLYGDQWVKYEYVVYRNNQINSYTDSVYVQPFDTTSVQVLY